MNCSQHHAEWIHNECCFKMVADLTELLTWNCNVLIQWVIPLWVFCCNSRLYFVFHIRMGKHCSGESTGAHCLQLYFWHLKSPDHSNQREKTSFNYLYVFHPSAFFSIHPVTNNLLTFTNRVRYVYLCVLPFWKLLATFLLLDVRCQAHAYHWFKKRPRFFLCARVLQADRTQQTRQSQTYVYRLQK